jgi:hypothetical protein
MPTIQKFKTSQGMGSDPFSSELTTFSTNTTYYIRSYATNTAGTGYGNEIEFATLATVNTISANNVTPTGFIAGGDIAIGGGANIIERGIVYGTSRYLTIDAQKAVAEGEGTGIFSVVITGLPTGMYYYRAYVINGGGVNYGSELSQGVYNINEVYNPTTGKIWMDRNLGTDVASSSYNEAKTHLYQWGRGVDGHQFRVVEKTNTLSSSDSPGHGNFIISQVAPYDWRSPQNDILWQGVDGINNPCPEGFRVPTIAEWNEERLSWSSNNANGAANSPLKLPMPYYRQIDGIIYGGQGGNYWSSTIFGTSARNLWFDYGNATLRISYRASGFAVRCIKD